MGLLGGLFSKIDSAKRHVGGLLSDPVGRFDQTIGQVDDNMNHLGLLFDQAYGNPERPTQVTNDAAQAELLESLVRFSPFLAIDRVGQRRLIQDLMAGKGSGEYKLGDVTPGQQKALGDLFNQPVQADVMMNDKTLHHLLTKRVKQDGMTPQEIGRYAEYALAPRSKVGVDPSKAFQNPALINRGLLSGRYSYDATMPLGVGGEGELFVRTIYPDGLPKKKPR